MKKLKNWTISSFCAFAIILFFMEHSFAREQQPNNLQIVTITCTDNDGNVTGYGNSCVSSTGFNCVGHSCGHTQ